VPAANGTVARRIRRPRGAEYEELLVDGRLIMQLYRLEIGHHHGMIGDPGQPAGNGVALWFEAADFDAAAVPWRPTAVAARGTLEARSTSGSGRPSSQLAAVGRCGNRPR
jgi:hypothetical protein